MTQSATRRSGLALAGIAAWFTISAVLISMRFSSSPLELQQTNHQRFSRIASEALMAYFRRVKFVTEYAASDPAFRSSAAAKQDKIRFSTLSRGTARIAAHKSDISTILERPNPTKALEPAPRGSVFT